MSMHSAGESNSGFVDRRADYGPAVEEAKSMSQEEFMSLVETPQEALSAVVLLDQMPRNIYRGLEAVQVR